MSRFLIVTKIRLFFHYRNTLEKSDFVAICQFVPSKGGSVE